MSIEEECLDQARLTIQGDGFEKMSQEQILSFVNGILQQCALPNAGNAFFQKSELPPMVKFLQKLEKENPTFSLKSQGKELVEEYLNALLAWAKEQGEDASVEEKLSTITKRLEI